MGETAKWRRVRRDRERSATEVLYVSSAPSPAEFQRMKDMRRPGVQEVTYGMSEAAFKFHNLVQSGLAAQEGCRVHSLVGRAASPRFYQGAYWPKVSESLAENHTVEHLGFPNRRVAKQICLAFRVLLACVAWRWRTRKSAGRVVIVDGAYVSAMPAVLCGMFGASRTTTIGTFCDLYPYMVDVSDASQRRGGFVYRCSRAVTAWSIARLDTFVVLTQHMSEILRVGSRPVLVMEGLVDGDLINRQPSAETKTRQPSVLYAGALRKEYGLETLVQGFQLLPDESAQLIIFGQGDYASELAQIAERDARIEFGGAIALAEVLEQEERAWLLVNPRPVDREFTKYSFPSKNMEYLASGTPVLTTRLPGMPAEYYEYVMTIDAPGREGMRQALEAALAMGPHELEVRGRRGKEFVMTEKNNVVQTARILALVPRPVSHA